MHKEHLKLLGTHRRDPITNVTGYVTSVSYDLNGCVMVAIKPPIDKDGKIPDGLWCDIERTEATNDVSKPAIKTFYDEKMPERPELRRISGPAEKPPK